MSKRMAALLAEPEQIVTSFIRKLEHQNGYPSHDARLMAENVQKVRTKIIDLGLDPGDTTGEELYHALLSRFERDSKKFEEHFGAEEMTLWTRLAKASELVAQYLDTNDQWALKNKAAKDALKKNPPKKVMKHLHYRSIESLLKRENTCEVFLAAEVLESALWHKNMQRTLSKMDQSNFELRPVRILALPAKKWLDAADKYAVFDRYIATSALWPSSQTQKMPLLTMVVLLMEEIDSDIKVGTKLVQMGAIAVWWADMDHLIAELSSEHVSLSLKDNAVNSLHENNYQTRSLDHGRFSFWNELLSRYENLPELEGPFDNSVKEKIAEIKFNTAQPAYEFAEDF